MPDDAPAPQPDPPVPPVESPAVPPAPAARLAWQPFTPRGVAAFAGATTGRVWLMFGVMAALSAGVIFWFLSTAWFPVVRAAIQALPNEGAIRGQQLDTPRRTLEPLAETEFLAFVVNAADHPGDSLSADVRVEFGPGNFRVCSLPGCLQFAYPAGWHIQFNRPELEPWWGAWQPILLGLAAVGAFVLLPAIWTALAALYCPVVFLVAYFKDRRLTWRASRRLAAAALMPGAALMLAGILAYGWGAIDLIRFTGVVLLHFLAPWVYLFVSPMTLPRVEQAPVKPNPFTE